jgi:hypothetical protein
VSLAGLRGLGARQARPAAGPAADECAIVRTVLYSALFDYPLTLAQLRQTLVGLSLTPSEILAAYSRSETLQRVVEHRDGFFFPRGRHDLIQERLRREARSHAFLRRHRRLLRLLCAMPYVRMVALSGSAAHLNLAADGDLDLFIVTRGRRVWSVTVAAILLAKLLRRRRIVCANFVVADSCLALEQQDLFTASQVVHLKPLVGREVYRDLLAANPFVRRFYPNFHPASPAWSILPRRRAWRALGAAKRVAEVLLEGPSRPVEILCRWSYRWYLMRRAGSWRSPEQVQLRADRLKLHTQSHRRSVLDRLDRAVADALAPVSVTSGTQI